MKQESPTNQVRDYVLRKYIEPSRRRRDITVRIVAGEVHGALGLNNRFPTVCNALSARKFLKENHLALEKREGPPKGLGARVTFTFRLLDELAPASGEPAQPSLMSLRGIGKDLFESVGGGEAFIRREREHFYDADEDV
jgi:5-methylcytosine-specific restriction protein B